MKGRPLIERLGYAAAGLREAVARERSFRTHLRFAGAAVLALLVLRPSPVWWGLVGLVATLVLAFEMINSALEGSSTSCTPLAIPRSRLSRTWRRARCC